MTDAFNPPKLIMATIRARKTDEGYTCARCGTQGLGGNQVKWVECADGLDDFLGSEPRREAVCLAGCDPTPPHD
jgi:hypothetical protein